MRGKYKGAFGSLGFLRHHIMSLHHPMHNRYIRPRNLVHRDITDGVSLLGRVREEEQVSTVECGFHGSTDKVRRRFETFNQPYSLLSKFAQRKYLRTTTIGDSVLVKSPSPFQIMRPEAMTDAKLSTCSRIWVLQNRSCAVSSSSFFAIDREREQYVSPAKALHRL